MRPLRLDRDTGCAALLRVEHSKGMDPGLGYRLGTVFFDEDFWRSEQAQVVAFADPWDTHADKPEIVREKTARWLERTAENYGVPILSLEDLREYALIYGEEYVEEHG